MLKLSYTKQFKKDYKKAVRRGLDKESLKSVIKLLQNGERLPLVYRDHKLTNSKHYFDMRECHINGDWLLVYQVQEKELTLNLIRTGTHSDLF